MFPELAEPPLEFARKELPGRPPKPRTRCRDCRRRVVRQARTLVGLCVQCEQIRRYRTDKEYRATIEARWSVSLRAKRASQHCSACQQLVLGKMRHGMCKPCADLAYRQAAKTSKHTSCQRCGGKISQVNRDGYCQPCSHRRLAAARSAR